MSKKKSQKIYQLPPPPVKETKDKESPENCVYVLFQKILKEDMKINHKIDNDYITIVPYCVSDFEGREVADDDVVCYEIYPKSNKKVVVYLDDHEMNVALDKTVLKLSDDETLFMAANIIKYVKKYCA